MKLTHEVLSRISQTPWCDPYNLDATVMHTLWYGWATCVNGKQIQVQFANAVCITQPRQVNNLTTLQIEKAIQGKEEFIKWLRNLDKTRIGLKGNRGFFRIIDLQIEQKH